LSAGLDVEDRTLQASDIAAWQIQLFLCPSDGSSWSGPRTDAGNLSGFPVGQSNYKGVSGANWGADSSQNWAVINTYWRNQGTNGSYDGLDNGDGIMFRSDYRIGLSMTDIKDGTSNTFMLGEDIPSLNDYCSWPSANNAYGTCAIPPNAKSPNGGKFDPSDRPNRSACQRIIGIGRFAKHHRCMDQLEEDLPLRGSFTTIQAAPTSRQRTERSACPST
jgi:hypothetical protein